MNSVRERIVQAVMTRLSAGISPVPVLRMPTVPVTREASPALLLFLEADRIMAHTNTLVDRALTLRIVGVVRGPDAWDVADRMMVAAHAALLADPNLGGLAITIREVDGEWDSDDADGGAVALPARYDIRYRTHAIDLTQMTS